MTNYQKQVKEMPFDYSAVGDALGTLSLSFVLLLSVFTGTSIQLCTIVFNLISFSVCTKQKKLYTPTHADLNTNVPYQSICVSCKIWSSLKSVKITDIFVNLPPSF